VYRNTGRLMFVSDGVFAITITLLVLEIRPPTDYRELLHGLGEKQAYRRPVRDLRPRRVSIVSSNARITLGSTGQSARAYTQVTWSSSRAPATGHAARTRARAAARAGMSARRATQTEAVLALSAPLRRA
jgi:hypothetical protein